MKFIKLNRHLLIYNFKGNSRNSSSDIFPFVIDLENSFEYSNAYIDNEWIETDFANHHGIPSVKYLKIFPGIIFFFSIKHFGFLKYSFTSKKINLNVYSFGVYKSFLSLLFRNSIGEVDYFQKTISLGDSVTIRFSKKFIISNYHRAKCVKMGISPGYDKIEITYGPTTN